MKNTEEIEDAIEKAEDVLSSAIGEYVREARKMVASEYGIDWVDSRLDYIDMSTGIGLGKSYERRDLYRAKNRVHEVYNLFLIPSHVRSKISSEDDIHLIHGFITKPIDEFVDNYVRSMIEDASIIIDYAMDYGEPGYTKDGDKDILFGDWNDIPNGIVGLIEESGYTIEWSDEWFIYYEESLAYRTQPDSWGWERSYFIADCELLPIEFFEEEYVEHVMNNTDMAVNSSIDLRKYGFVDFGDVCHESGWYGIVEDPKDVLEKAMEEEEFDDYIFQICSVEQFRVNFRLMIRNEEREIVA
jgi:hypothetical protein